MLSRALCATALLALCVSGAARAMDVTDKGDPALSVSSTPGALPKAPPGDPGLSVSSSPNPAIKKGDPALSVSSLSPDACAALVRHTPDADVNVQPGADARGNAVAPADLPGAPQMQIPKTITIPLTLSLAKVLNLDTSQFPASVLGPSTEAQLGVLTVTDDHVLFNGKPLSDEQQNNLAVLCMHPGK